MTRRPADKRHLAAGLLGLCVLGVCATAEAWTTPAPVAATAEDSLDPRLSVDPAGKAHVVWRERANGGLFHIQYATNANGAGGDPSGFAERIMISQGGSIGGGSPSVCATGEQVHAAWIASVADNYEIWYRRWTASGWGPIFNASSTSIKSLRPTVAARGGYGPVVAWDEAIYADDNYDTFFAEWTGAGFSPAINISNTPGGAVYGSVNVNIAVAANGDVTAAWADRISGAYHVNARRRLGGAWQPRQELSTHETGPATPGIAVTADNRVHVVYEAAGTIWYQAHNGTAWSTAAGLPGGLNSGIRPRVAVDDSGVVHVVCDAYTDAQNNRDIFYTNNLSGAFSAWTNLSSTAGTQSLVADIGYGSNVLTITWMENKNGPYQVWHVVGPKPSNSPKGMLTGCVYDDLGSVVPGAAVNVGGAYRGTTGADGRYTIGGIYTGTYTVTAGKPFYSMHSVSSVGITGNSTTYQDFTIAGVPPAAVARFSAEPGNTATVLNWTNPASGNFAGTLIRAKTGSYPTGSTDGIAVADVPGAAGSSGKATHAGLVNGTTWFYAAFAYSGAIGRYYADGVQASATPAGPGDFDRDGDVDQDDFGFFQVCLSGAYVPQNAPACARARFDADDDVDPDDLMRFVGCISGPGSPSNPGCLN